MKIIIFLSLLTHALYANQVSRAFKQFYNSELISSNHCGKNIFHFLNYLKNQGIAYNSGHVVSIHEPVLSGVRSFDARWGSPHKYKNGETFSHSNWYFHVFAIIDGIAYDFSQAGAKTQTAEKYLKSTYLPKYTTEKIFMVGEYTKAKALKEFKNMEMNIYKASDYREDYGPAVYTGVFLEYFNFLDDIDPQYSNLQSNPKKYSIVFNDAYVNADNSVTIEYPQVRVDSITYPLIAMPLEICRAFGYLGAVSKKLSYEVSDKVQALKLSSSFRNSDDRMIRTEDISIGWRIDETMGSVTSQPLFHYASEVTCSDLHSVLINL